MRELLPWCSYILRLLAFCAAAFYRLPEASAITVAGEGSGTAYFIGTKTPGGLGGGLRLDQPIIWGFGVGAGYQMVYLFSTAYPWNAHHAYAAIFYRIDDLPVIVPQFEGGAGAAIINNRVNKQQAIEPVFHFGASLDAAFSVAPATKLFVGVFVRYHIYLSSGLVPGAISGGLRAGLKLWE